MEIKSDSFLFDISAQAGMIHSQFFSGYSGMSLVFMVMISYILFLKKSFGILIVFNVEKMIKCVALLAMLLGDITIKLIYDNFIIDYFIIEKNFLTEIHQLTNISFPAVI
ncbi:MAG TPA: hypothetical protein ENL20_05665 [Candidatus Cloacimonetes bacterium]|nr:hypothetical protein [Candidatus Cloacimonadota bacterium]